MAAVTAVPPAMEVALEAKGFPALGGAPAKPVLEQVAFAVAPGETVALIGPSGCGKTTLLNILAGLEPAGEGRVRTLAGATVAYVFQEPRLLPWCTVAQNLALVLDGADDDPRIDQVLAEVGLEEARDVYASRLSLGMARRVALARGFIVGPDILLLDEPFVSLDEMSAGRLRRLLLDLLERHRVSAVFVTHDIGEAIMLADRLLVLSSSPGRLLHDVEVDLLPAERRSEQAVAAFRQVLTGRGVLAGGALSGDADGA